MTWTSNIGRIPVLASTSQPYAMAALMSLHKLLLLSCFSVSPEVLEFVESQ